MLSKDRKSLREVRVIFRAMPTYDGTMHYGSRLAFGPDGIGGLKDRVLVRLILEGGKVVAEEHLLAERDQRIRDVRQGADGALYVVTDESRGELWKITSRE